MGCLVSVAVIASGALLPYSGLDFCGVNDVTGNVEVVGEMLLPNPNPHLVICIILYIGRGVLLFRRFEP